jgi:hypothetical protein
VRWDPLGKDRKTVGDPMDILAVTQQGLSARGNVECDVGEADSGVVLQYDKESSDQGNKTCLSDDIR